MLHEALKVISVHSIRPLCLLPPPAAAQIRELHLQHRPTKSMSVLPSRLFRGRDLLVPSLPVDVVERRGCLRWKQSITRPWVSPAFQYCGHQSRLGYGVLQLVCGEPSTEMLSMFSLVRSDAPASRVSPVCPDGSCLISQFGVFPSRGSKGLMVAQPLLRAPRLQGGGGSKASRLLIQGNSFNAGSSQERVLSCYPELQTFKHLALTEAMYTPALAVELCLPCL